MPSRNPPNVEALIAEAAGLRRLAVRLVGEGEADDVLQDAVAAGIEHAPGEGRALRPWLVRVVRNFAAGRHRGDGRRSAREMDAARREPLPSASDLVERMEVQRAVADEVLRLDEPYRRAVLAVYFEGVGAEEYARGLGVPSATVRSWLKRGLDALRARLDRRFGGDRGAWSACLMPLAQPEAAAVPLAVGGVFLMKKFGVAAAVVLALLVLWAVFGIGGHRDPDSEVAGAVALESASPAPDAAAQGVVPVEGTDARVEAVTAAELTVAPQLAGRVVWLPDREPAVGIGVRVSRPERPDLGEPSYSETDAQGRFRIDEVGSGDFEVGLDRSLGVKRLHFAPGETREVELELPRAPKVVGRVLDASGAAVAGAEVCVSSQWSRCVTRSAADGSYAIEGVPSGPRVFARAAGHKPSGAYLLPSQDARYALDLWLGADPGAIEGRITNAAGDPMRGLPIAARISSETITDPAGVRSSANTPAGARADAHGAFALRDLRPGRYVLDFHALNRTKTTVVVEVRPGRTTRADVALPAMARLQGRVTDTGGAPCGGSHVEVSRVDGPAATSWILSDADGRYDTGFVPAGRVLLAVRHARGKLQVETDLAPGEDRDWSPVLGATAAIRGRVVDLAGRPFVGGSVSYGSRKLTEVRTDALGRFELTAKVGQVAAVTAWQGDVVGARRDAWPGDPEFVLVFEAPSARIVGRIVDSAGNPARDVAVWSDRFGTTQLDAEGRFETALLASGPHSLSVTPYGVGRCHLITVDLQAGETRSVGDLVLPRLGTLFVGLHPHADVDARRVQIVAYRLGISDQVVVSNGANRGGDWTAEGLPEGEYRISLWGGGAALMEKRCTIRAGETTLVDVEVHFGSPVRLDVRGDRLEDYAIEARDAAGEVVGRLDQRKYGPEPVLRLRPGRYEFNVTTTDGRTGSARVEVAADSEAEQVVRVDVR